MRLRQARFLAVLLATAIVVGLLYGGLLLAVDLPDALLTWWGTSLRAILAVLVCLGIAGFVDRRWNAR